MRVYKSLAKTILMAGAGALILGAYGCGLGGPSGSADPDGVVATLSLAFDAEESALVSKECEAINGQGRCLSYPVLVDADHLDIHVLADGRQRYLRRYRGTVKEGIAKNFVDSPFSCSADDQNRCQQCSDLWGAVVVDTCGTFAKSGDLFRTTALGLGSGTGVDGIPGVSVGGDPNGQVVHQVPGGENPVGEVEQIPPQQVSGCYSRGEVTETLESLKETVKGALKKDRLEDLRYEPEAEKFYHAVMALLGEPTDGNYAAQLSQVKGSDELGWWNCRAILDYDDREAKCWNGGNDNEGGDHHTSKNDDGGCYCKDFDEPEPDCQVFRMGLAVMRDHCRKLSAAEDCYDVKEQTGVLYGQMFTVGLFSTRKKNKKDRYNDDNPVHVTLYRDLGSIQGPMIDGYGSPLVLDLAGDGLSLTAAEEGVAFDLFGMGVPVRTAWIQGDDALLVLDFNGDGTIQSGVELFGHVTGGRAYDNGFQALGSLDSAAKGGDENGIVDGRDLLFGELRVWNDHDRNGVATASELRTLAEVGVKALSVAMTSNLSAQDDHGNDLGMQGEFIRSDGSTGSMIDVLFRLATGDK